MSRIRQQRADLEHLADTFGCELQIDATRRGHIRATFRAGRKETAVVMAKGHGATHAAGRTTSAEHADSFAS